jgi:hypothetical protein
MAKQDLTSISFSGNTSSLLVAFFLLAPVLFVIPMWFLYYIEQKITSEFSSRGAGYSAEAQKIRSMISNVTTRLDEIE